MTFQQHIDALHSALAQTRIDSGGPATCSVMAEDLRVALHLIGQAELVPSAASAEPVSKYFHRVAGCPTHRASDAECICWHDKGTGPYPDARVGDIYNGVTLTWRTKPATPVAASAEPVADEVTPEMMRAAHAAAREYYERTGGNDPAVIYRAMRRVAPVAAQAPVANRDVDPLQGAADWLVQAHGRPSPTVLCRCLMIGYNRAQRLYDAAIAAQQGKGGEA
ncbi:hypothetical protein [Bordetella hinzii]|uniref:hypothetical protein n=1 Tax=Bordetella hinzii TaxID=103855 RepID=UPI001150A780|nr:hypothetical protein [Bordetella hinzii]QDJ57288.1 hypothetical protein CBR72_21935 [Bordetella hinzii]